MAEAEKKETTKVEETKKEEAKKPTLIQQLDAITFKNREALKLKQAEDQKNLLELGRSKNKERRVQSATKISGLRGLEPKLGMQFYKKTTEG